MAARKCIEILHIGFTLKFRCPCCERIIPDGTSALESVLPSMDAWQILGNFLTNLHKIDCVWNGWHYIFFGIHQPDALRMQCLKSNHQDIRWSGRAAFKDTSDRGGGTFVIVVNSVVDLVKATCGHLTVGRLERIGERRNGWPAKRVSSTPPFTTYKIYATHNRHIPQ